MEAAKVKPDWLDEFSARVIEKAGAKAEADMEERLRELSTENAK